MNDEELEYTLLNKRDVLVYQIPPASSSSGHKADDWKNCIWRGRCRIAGKGQDLSIKLLDGSSGKLFAQCAIPGGEHDKYVERVIDSSRYFVLKITNGDRHAFIGMGFEDRNDAFDFNCTLSDFKSTWVDKGKEVEEAAPISDTPQKDLSLKEGQKITINLKGMGGTRRRTAEEAGGDGGGFGAFALAPPPSSGQSRRAAGGSMQPLGPPPGAGVAPAPSQAAARPAAAAQDDFFGDFDDFQSAGGGFQSAPAPAPVAASAPAPAVAAAAAPSMDALAGQLGQLDFGVQAPAAQPAMASAPVAAAQQTPVQQPAPSFDMFSGLGGGAPAPAPMAAMAAPAAAPGQRKGNDPFDDFDIFK